MKRTHGGIALNMAFDCLFFFFFCRTAVSERAKQNTALSSPATGWRGSMNVCRRMRNESVLEGVTIAGPSSTQTKLAPKFTGENE